MARVRNVRPSASTLPAQQSVVEVQGESARPLASQASFEKYGRKSKREQFLETIESIVSWSELDQAALSPGR